MLLRLEGSDSAGMWLIRRQQGSTTLHAINE